MRRPKSSRTIPTSQAGFTGVELLVVAVVALAILAVAAIPLWIHGTSLQISATKTTLQVGESTDAAVVAYEKPRWSLTSRPVNGSVRLSFPNGVRIQPGGELTASKSTGTKGEATFSITAGKAGLWFGTAKITVGGKKWDNTATLKIKVPQRPSESGSNGE